MFSVIYTDCINVAGERSDFDLIFSSWSSTKSCSSTTGSSRLKICQNRIILKVVFKRIFAQNCCLFNKNNSSQETPLEKVPGSSQCHRTEEEERRCSWICLSSAAPSSRSYTQSRFLKRLIWQIDHLFFAVINFTCTKKLYSSSNRNSSGLSADC